MVGCLELEPRMPEASDLQSDGITNYPNNPKNLITFLPYILGLEPRTSDYQSDAFPIKL